MNSKSTKKFNKKNWISLICVILVACIVTGLIFAARQRKEYTHAFLGMDTMITQTAYGPNATAAMLAVEEALLAYAEQLSLFNPTSDIARINESAGGTGVEVSSDTVQLLQQGLQLSAQSKGAFALSIAPLTLAWGITTATPHVPTQEELDALLPLVDDTAISIEGNVVTLFKKGMGIDLGGIAKGAACTIARDIYMQHGVTSACLSIGGNIYAYGTKPGGTQFRIGFKNPTGGVNAYIASFHLEDAVIAVSGGYERYFEQDGQRYIHVFNPQTGYPAESDILSVGVIHPDGAVADFYSTTLFVQGAQSALQYMRQGGNALFLDDTDTLYVSESLRDSFTLNSNLSHSYTIVYVPGDITT